MMVKYTHPEEIDGHTIVAVTADRVTGLYRQDEDYFLIDAAEDTGVVTGSMRREELGQYGYPKAPQGRWTWIQGRQPWATESATPIAEKAVSVAPSQKAKVTSGLSKTHTCADCEKNVREDSHAHSTIEGMGGTPITLCCPCTKKRGHGCSL